jgi:hypothetical protein
MTSCVLVSVFLFACSLFCSIATAATFKGYECTQDCSDHEAGYKWARKKGITNRDHCTGKSKSFVEGCRAWADGR